MSALKPLLLPFDQIAAAYAELVSQPRQRSHADPEREPLPLHRRRPRPGRQKRAKGAD